MARKQKFEGGTKNRIIEVGCKMFLENGFDGTGIRAVMERVGADVGVFYYYFNTKELTGNKYGTPSPVPFRVVDQRAGIDIDIAIRCFGEYSYRIVNPILFYTNVCGNVSEDYKTENIAGQMKTELLTALQPAFAKISEMGVRYSALPGHTTEIAEALNDVGARLLHDLDVRDEHQKHQQH